MFIKYLFPFAMHNVMQNANTKICFYDYIYDETQICRFLLFNYLSKMTKDQQAWVNDWSNYT